MSELAASGLPQGQPMPSVPVSGHVSGGLQASVCGLIFAPALFGVSGGGIVFDNVIVHTVPALAIGWLVKACWQRVEA